MRSVIIGGFAVTVLGLTTVLVPMALASHWCDQTTFSFSPSSPSAGRATTFTLDIRNNGVDNTQLDSVQMKFSWEGTWRDAGSGTILAGQSGSYSAQATPPSAGSYSVELKAHGTSSGDWLHETIDCTSTASITAVQAPAPGFDGWLAVLVIGVVGAAAAAKRRT